MKSNWLERMAPAERSHAFSGLMKDAGEECAAVSRFYFRGDLGLNAAWNIRCTDTGAWMVLIAANGWTRVAGCARSEEHTSELQSLMRLPYAVFCLTNKTDTERKTEP